MNAIVQKKENGGVGKQIWKPFSKLSPYKTDNIFLNSQRFSQEANSENVLIFHFLKKLWVEAGNIA